MIVQFLCNRRTAAHHRSPSAHARRPPTICRRSGQLFFLLLVLLGCGHRLAAQRGEYTQNKPDQVLRGSGRVNPSTHGMEFGVPLGGYPGRGLNLPISLSYSSKVWRLQYFATFPTSGNQNACHPASRPVYSENAASGWTSGVSIPYLEYTGAANIYDSDGFPLNDSLCPGTGNSGNGTNNYVRRIEVHLPGGEAHELRPDGAIKSYLANSNCTPGSQTCDPDDLNLPANWNLTYYAVDGSNLRYEQDSTTGRYRLWLPDGAFYDFAPATTLLDPSNVTDFNRDVRRATQLTDPNGNVISYHSETGDTYPNGYVTDTLGRHIPLPFGATGPPAVGVQPYRLPGFGGGTPLTYQLHWQKLKGTTPATSGLTDFNQSLAYRARERYDPYQPSTRPADSIFLFSSGAKAWTLDAGDLFNPVVLTAIDLPDGSSYRFSYNIYGEIEQIKYPTGGAETFQYLALPPQITYSGQDTNNGQENRGVGTRQIFETAGATTATAAWTYSASNAGGYSLKQVNPDGTWSQRWQVLNEGYPCGGTCTRGSFGYGNVLGGMIYEEDNYTSANQLLSKKLTTWTSSQLSPSVQINTGIAGVNGAGWFPRVTKEESIIDDPATGNGVSTTTALEYEGDLNQRDTPLLTKKSSQYGFVAAGGALPATPVRTSETTYLQNDPRYAAVRGDYLAQNMVGLATVAVVKDGAGTVSRSEMKYDEVDSPSACGNPTDARVWDSTKGLVTDPAAYIATHARFDTWGNRVEARDAKGNTTTTVYDTANHAFPVSVTTPAPGDGVSGSNTAFTTGATFDPVTGLPLTTTDVNGQITQIFYEDPLLRPTKVIAPNGQQTVTEYGAGTSAATRFVKARTQIDATNWKEGYAWYDGLGRTYKTQAVKATGDVFVETEFDYAGRAYRVTNPYRTGEAKVWTTNVYDEAGRVKEVDLADGATVKTAYGVATSGLIGLTKQITDQAGKKRQGISDALGRMVRVIEDPAGQNLATDYVFDTLGNLRQTIQGEQSRYFNYDSLGRLLYAKQPEQEANAAFVATDALTNNTQWSVKYEYDDNGNITKTTDARNVSITGTYDHFNRLTMRHYSDGTTPDVGFYYDGTGLGSVPDFSKGKTTKVTSSVSETRFTSFDNLGRLLQNEQRTPFTDSETIATAIPRVSSYQYDNFGKLLAETYPSGRTVNYDYNQDGEVARIGGAVNGQARLYANGFAYDAAGDLQQMHLGNGKWETAQYNTRLQVTQIGLGNNAGDTSLLKLEFGYGDNTQNNGSLRSQKISFSRLSQPFEQTYTYDDLNRLQAATETVNNGATINWKQSFSYDRFGNRRFDANNTTNFTSNDVTNPLIDTATNRFAAGQSYQYDKNGNLTNDATGKLFAYDAESHQKEVRDAGNNVIGTYLYDGEGKRVKKISATETTVFVYDGGGQLVAEYSTVTAVPQDAKISYLTDDHLGSARVITDQNGQVVARKDYGAFGDEIGSSQRTQSLKYQPTGIRQDYTGYQKDDESGLEFAQARYYNTLHGRFTSVDPLTASASIRDPQTFNRYSYGLNSPYKFTDPLGLIYNGAGNAGRTGSSGFCSAANDNCAEGGGEELTTQSIDEHRKQQDQTQVNPHEAIHQVALPNTVRESVILSYEITGTFTINWSNETQDIFPQGVFFLTSSMQNFLANDATYFFNRGVQEGARFQAAIEQVNSLANNLTSAAAPPIEIIQRLRQVTSTARLGEAIPDLTSIGGSIGAGGGGGSGSIGASIGMAANNAIGEYNRYLAETSTELKVKSAVFSDNDHFANTGVPITTYNRNHDSFFYKLPLDTGSLQNLYRSRLGIAVTAGRNYVK